MIQMRNVFKTVTSGVERITIVDDVTVEVPGGQFVAVTGPSGSGKSTLLSLVAGLDSPTSGQILIGGRDITRMSEDELADMRSGGIGFVFQAFHLIPALTAYENVLVPMEIAAVEDAPAKARSLIEAVGLGARGHHYPAQLSGGEQQRVAIARAFSNEPRILLADEPTGNLDPRNGARVFDLLVSLNRERRTTLLLVTHESSLAAVADRVLSLDAGRIVDDTAA